jgi:predicted PurR-regulated permease PerM
MDDGDPARARARLIGKMALVTLLAAFGLWIAAGFVPAFLWAVVIAVAVDPLRERWIDTGRSVGARTSFALIATLAVALLVLIPLVLFVAEAAREAHELLRWMAAARANGVPVPAWVHTLPFGANGGRKTSPRPRRQACTSTSCRVRSGSRGRASSAAMSRTAW